VNQSERSSYEDLRNHDDRHRDGRQKLVKLEVVFLHESLPRMYERME